MTVDALNLHRYFNDGLILTMEIKTTRDKALTRASYVLAEQISFASVIILTKIDMIDEATIQRQINNLKKMKVNFASLTLHVNGGTFLPIRNNNPYKHSMHFERGTISKIMAVTTATMAGKHFTKPIARTTLRSSEMPLPASKLNSKVKGLNLVRSS